MTLLTFNVPEVGQPDKTEDPKIANALTTLLAWANGNIDATNFAAAYKDGEAAAECLRTLGTGAKQAAPGNLVIVKEWTAPALNANWSSSPTGGQPAGYRLSTDSTMVELKGELRNQVEEKSVMFTLPAGFRPAHSVRVAYPWWDGSVKGVGTLVVEPTGFVYIEEGRAYGRATLDGIRFPLT